jgi:hypothetical protein
MFEIRGHGWKVSKKKNSTHGTLTLVDLYIYVELNKNKNIIVECPRGSDDM